MKAIVLSQPIAHLVAHGYVTSMHRFLPEIITPERYYICAAENNDICQDDLILFDRDYSSQIRNAQILGDLPLLEKLPTSAIVGYVDIIKCEVPKSGQYICLTDWFKDCYFANAHFFDDPVPCHLYSHELNSIYELPKNIERVVKECEYRAKRPLPISRNEKFLQVSLSDELFERYASLNFNDSSEFFLHITSENLSLLCETFDGKFEVNPLETDIISFFHKGVTLDMKVLDIEFQDVEVSGANRVLFKDSNIPSETFKAKIVYKITPLSDSTFNTLEASSKIALEAAYEVGYSAIVEHDFHCDKVFLNGKQPINFQGKQMTVEMTVFPKDGTLSVKAQVIESMKYYTTGSVLQSINKFNKGHLSSWLSFDNNEFISAHTCTTFVNDILDKNVVVKLINRVLYEALLAHKHLFVDLQIKNKKKL